MILIVFSYFFTLSLSGLSKHVVCGLFPQRGVQKDILLHHGNYARAAQQLPGLVLRVLRNLDPVNIAVDASMPAEIAWIELCASRRP